MTSGGVDLARLIDDLRTRIADPGRQTDMDPWEPLPPPASSDDFRRAESVIGCPLPQVIVHVYSTVANGGFGPGYGLVGIGGGRPGFATWEERWHCEGEYAKLRQDNEAMWPEYMIPLCHWGCGIYSCADVSTPDAVMSTSLRDFRDDEPPYAFAPTGCTFAEWLRAWADGQDLWKALNDSLASS